MGPRGEATVIDAGANYEAQLCLSAPSMLSLPQTLWSTPWSTPNLIEGMQFVTEWLQSDVLAGYQLVANLVFVPLAFSGLMAPVLKLAQSAGDHVTVALNKIKRVVSNLVAMIGPVLLVSSGFGKIARPGV